MRNLRFAVFGTGFWANYQIAAWQELEGVELVALYNRTRSKAEAMGQKFGIERVYDNADDLLANEELDFIDIITDVDTHAVLVEKAAAKGIHVICQKPMAADFPTAQRMVAACQRAGVKFFIHENFRWQAPIRRLKEVLDSGVIGEAFKARLTFCTAFPVFDNQPFLAELDQLILTDLGSHLLDIGRFLFGEAQSLYCQTARINPAIKGEDVASVFLKMRNGVQCYVEISFASILEKEAFPQTLILVEGSEGSLHLTTDFILNITTRSGTRPVECKPKMYDWLNPDYAVVHSSIVDCNRDLLNGLRGGKSETTGEDNFETVRLVHACYESAGRNAVITL
ncbi:MAG: Gfo/Idh/MocA family oxidoreductase [Cytophagaceae bacterium]|nr:Gfo/Idh/MocA family oxidoreductase [Cytophagaceae bacterium]